MATITVTITRDDGTEYAETMTQDDTVVAAILEYFAGEYSDGDPTTQETVERATEQVVKGWLSGHRAMKRDEAIAALS